MFGPGLYVMAVSFAPELIPVHLLAKLAQGEASTPLPPMPEMLAVTLLLEIVREAGLRAPKSISHTVSLVGALIIGETAVSAGIISVPVLTMPRRPPSPPWQSRRCMNSRFCSALWSYCWRDCSVCRGWPAGRC